MSDKPTIFLYTDGAASGNPGPGGFGVVLRCGTYEKEMSGGFRCTTNNRMELLAVITGLEAIKWDNAMVEVYSDSSYVVKAINEGWLQNWERKGWKKSQKTLISGSVSCRSTAVTAWHSTGSRDTQVTRRTKDATVWRFRPGLALFRPESLFRRMRAMSALRRRQRTARFCDVLVFLFLHKHATVKWQKEITGSRLSVSLRVTATE
jgi:Ribonuclease HI